jgi:hypothetical protein
MSNTKNSDSGAAEGARRATEQSPESSRTGAGAGRVAGRPGWCWNYLAAPMWRPCRVNTA